MRLTTKYSFLLQCVLLLLLYDNKLASGSSCRTGCSGTSNNLIKLDEGVTYVYNLEGNTETSLPKSKGPNGESVKLNLKAKVEVSALPQCGTLIKLKGVQVTGPDGKKHASLDKLEAHPLLVSLNGGRLDSEVCAAAEDDYTSLNIKRAVASLFQANTGEDGGSANEVDVFGNCPTDFQVRKENNVVTVTKRRNLNNCAYREGLHQLWFAVPHGHSSDAQTTPLLEPDFEVEQKIQNKILESAIVKESYLFKPFSNKDNGARTKVITKLTLESKSSAAPPAHKNSQPRSIIFEDPHEVVTTSLQSVQSALQKVVDSFGEAVPTSAAHDFENLVTLTRRASKDDLISIYGNAKSGAGFKNKDLAKKVFIDALFQARSADSVSVAIELLKNHEIEGLLAQAWYLSFAFVRHTNAAALASAASLLDEPKLPHLAYLGVGALAGQYCREHVCESVPEFNQLVSKLAKNIEHPTKEKEHAVLASLKALKNVKRLNDDAAGKVIQIIKDNKASARVRVAALETAQSDACRAKIQKAATDILSNKEEDSELRIKAYLVLVECPNAKTANRLNEILEVEQVNQVGAYITSHLRNLRASVNPDKEGAREVLQNVRPKRKFPIDIRKFSHNQELSHRFDILSTSASLESNVIFSQKSYLPRSANLNLTTEVFGQAFNLVELNARAENLDRIVEKFFGPKSYLRTHKPEEVIKEGKEQLEKLRNYVSDKYKNTVRGKRSVTRQQTDAFANKVKLFNTELDKDVDVDLSVSLLGNELLWLHLDDDKTPSVNNILNQLSELVNRELGKYKDFSKDIKSHTHFLDSKLSYPTSTGFPLQLTATGSAVAHVKLGGALDLGEILKNPKNGELKFKIIPSASLEVTGELSVDAYAVEAGLKVVGTLHTATGTDVHLKLLDGHGFDLDVGLPVKNADILTVTSEVLQTVKERGQAHADHKLEFSLPRKDFHGCFDQLQAFLGVTFCGDLAFPLDQQPLITNAALYPLNGNSKVSLRAEKEENLKSYHLKFYFNIDDPKNRKLEVKLDTPGSKVPREISLVASAVTEPNRVVSVKFVSPIHSVAVEGAIVENDKEYSVSASATLDTNVLFKGRLGVLINGATYTPILEYTPIGGAQVDVKVEGTVTVDKKGPGYRKYTFNSVRILANNVAYSVDGNIIRDTNLLSTDLKLGYDKNTVGVKTKFQRQGDKNLKINAEVQPSQYPDFSFALKYEYQRDDTHVENSLIFVHGPDLTSKHHRLTVFQQTHYKAASATSFDVSTKNTLTYPVFEIEGKFEGAITKKSVNYDLELSYAKQKLKSRLSAKTSVNKFGDYEIVFQASAAEKEIIAEAKREVLDTYKSKFTNKLTLKPGGQYELNGEVTHQFKVNDVNARLNAQVKVQDIADDYRLDIGAITNPALFDGHGKVSVGANDLFSGALKFARKAPLTGNFKLNIRNVVESHGDYKYGEGKGNGQAVINVLPLKRKFKGSADLNVAGSKHTGVIEIFFDADKDNNKKLHIVTDTDITSSSIASKNKLKLQDKELQVDFQGECYGKATNGRTTGKFEVVIPSGRVITGTLKESLQLASSASNFELAVELTTAEKKGAHPTKIFLDTYAKNVDLKRYQFDSKFDLGYECHAGRHVYAQTVRSGPQDGKLVVDFQNSISGVLDKPITNKVHVTVSRIEVTYAVHVFAWEVNVDNVGRVHHELNHVEVEHQTEVKTPLDIAKYVLSKTKVHVHLADEKTPAYQVNVNQDVVVDERKVKVDVAVEASHTKGFVKVLVEAPKIDPVSVNVDYKHEHGDSDLRKAALNVKVNYEKDKTVDVNVKSDYTRDLGHVTTHVIGKSPFKQVESYDLLLTHKRISTVSRNTDLKLTLNGQKIDGYANIDLTPNHPVIDVVLNQPDGKSRFYYKLDRKSDRQADSEGQVTWTLGGGGHVDFNTKVDLESLDNFIVTIYVNSAKYDLNKLKLELGNRLTKSGAAKRINFAAQTADKKGFSGSVSYAVKENDSGFVIDGKGIIEIQNEKHPLTYKAVFKKLAKATDKEVGTSFVLNADYGKGQLDVIHKVTDKEFHYKTKACLSDCALFEIKSKLDIIDYVEIRHDASFTYENNLNGRSDSLSVLSKTHRKGLYADHETGIKVKDLRYVLKSYLHEKDAAVVIELPTREIEAKATYELPIIGKGKGIPNSFQVRFDGSLALDKKKAPKDAANLLVVGDLTTAQKAVSLNGEVKFSHPQLQKDLTIRTKGSAGFEKRLLDASVELDIFNKKNQKIVAAVRVDHDRTATGHNVTGKIDFTSKGLVLDIGSSGHVYSAKDGFSVGAFAYYADNKNVKKEWGGFVEGSRTRLFGVVKVPNKELARLDAKIQATKGQQTVEAEYTVLERQPAVLKVEVIGWQQVKACLHRKDNPKVRLEGSVEISSKQLEVKAEKVVEPERKSLFFVTLKLDDTNALKHSYDLNSENLKELVTKVKEELNDVASQYQTLIKTLTEELLKELKEILENLKKAQPNLKPLLDQYQAQFDAIRKELASDPEFKKIAEAVQKVLVGILNAFDEKLKKIIEIYQKLQTDIIEIQEKLVASYKKLVPEFLKHFEKALDAVRVVFQRATEFLTVAIAQVLEILKENEADIRVVITQLAENFKEISKVSVQTIEKMRHEIEDFIKLVLDQIKAMPIYSELQERYGELIRMEIPEQFWHFYYEFTFAVEDFLPTPELKELAKKIFVYIEKRLRKQEVDDAALLKSLSEEGLKALRSILKYLQAENYIEDPAELLKFDWKLSSLPLTLARLPTIKSIGDWSVLRQLRAITDLPSVTDYYYTYRPTLNPLDYIPPYKANAYILNSHHFFTFDRKHFAFKGSCSYILAQDFLDGNFSIIANIDNGKIKSITVNDRTDSVEWLNDNTIILNGKAGDFPIHQNDISGWRDYASTTIKHQAGVWIRKYSKLDLIYISINGFYFGRTRGLLGTINNEQYDEFTLPNGHIAKDGAEFGNAYKVSDSCAAVPEMKHTIAHSPECTKFFTSESSLRRNFPYINPDIYREACDLHAVMSSSDKLKAACDVVYAYAVALRKEHVPLVSIPNECAKCTVEGKQVDLGHSDSITTPSGKADVVLVIEQSAHNSPVFKELVTPLIASLSSDLKEKGLGDVEFAVIGYNHPHHDWPGIYGNNGKLTYEGKGDNIVFGEREKSSESGPYDTIGKKIKYLYKLYKIELGKESIVQAMNEANAYPFRQGAAKIIILVNSSPCSRSPLFPVSLQVLRYFQVTKLYKDRGFNFYIISPLADLTIANKADQKHKNIVGFDKEKIYTIADAKKKPLEGEATNRENLSFNKDLCLGFSQDYGDAAFSSQNFLDAKPDQKKKFVQVVSQRIVQGATAYKYKEDCTCNLYKGMYAYSECKVSSKDQA